MELIPCLTDLMYCSKKRQMQHETETCIRKNLTKKLLINLYAEQQTSLRQTSHKLHYSVNTICDILNIYAIPYRSSKNASKLRGAPSHDPKTVRFRLPQDKLCFLAEKIFDVQTIPPRFFNRFDVWMQI